MNTRHSQFPVHLGTVTVGPTSDGEALLAVFAPSSTREIAIEASGATVPDALRELGAEMRTIADSIDGAARRLSPLDWHRAGPGNWSAGKYVLDRLPGGRWRVLKGGEPIDVADTFALGKELCEADHLGARP